MHQGSSFENFLQSCMIPPKESQESSEDSSNIKFLADNSSDESANIASPTEAPKEDSKMQINPNTAANLVSVADKKTGKICKHTWRGTKCQIQDCQNIHIEPCQDRECRALDDGLPLYKT